NTIKRHDNPYCTSRADCHDGDTASLWKHRNDTSVVELEESEWYDENGNHIYYDRKLIRYLEKTARKNNSCSQKQTEGSEPFDESRWYDENGNHLYYDRKIIWQQQKGNARKTPRM
nr:hypothetical protein [Bacteroides thetaiotaomicron]MDC2229245.1 hypothetical protein [Bacteroides thetaiotaomicron]MDC2239691.1 hypothetical protein [Bacteroides thetaiotaomicron]